MAAELIDVADAVAAAINGASLGAAVAAARAYQPTWQLDDLGDGAYRADVVPRGRSGTQEDRGRNAYDYAVDVVLHRKADPTPANLDAAMLVAQNIDALFRSKRLAGYDAARCVAVVNDPAFSPEILEEDRRFVSVLTLTFRVWR